MTSCQNREAMDASRSAASQVLRKKPPRAARRFEAGDRPAEGPNRKLASAPRNPYWRFLAALALTGARIARHVTPDAGAGQTARRKPAFHARATALVCKLAHHHE